LVSEEVAVEGEGPVVQRGSRGTEGTLQSLGTQKNSSKPLSEDGEGERLVLSAGSGD
jgi:hypothetical protein